jgi:hypothetical protein
MQAATIKVQINRPAMAQKSMALRPRQLVLVRSAPDKAQIDQALKEAEEACAGGDKGEW